jgi:uncharacterized membrane protein
MQPLKRNTLSLLHKKEFRIEMSVGNIMATVCWVLKGVLLIVLVQSHSNQTYILLCNTDTLAYSYSGKNTQVFLAGGISVFSRPVCEYRNDTLHIEKSNASVYYILVYIHTLICHACAGSIALPASPVEV